MDESTMDHLQPHVNLEHVDHAQEALASHFDRPRKLRKRNVGPTLKQKKEKLRRCLPRAVGRSTKIHSPCQTPSILTVHGQHARIGRNHLACGEIIVQRPLKEPCETCNSCFWEKTTTTITGFAGERRDAKPQMGWKQQSPHKTLGNCWRSDGTEEGLLY